MKPSSRARNLKPSKLSRVTMREINQLAPVERAVGKLKRAPLSPVAAPAFPPS